MLLDFELWGFFFFSHFLSLRIFFILWSYERKMILCKCWCSIHCFKLPCTFAITKEATKIKTITKIHLKLKMINAPRWTFLLDHPKMHHNFFHSRYSHEPPGERKRVCRSFVQITSARTLRAFKRFTFSLIIQFIEMIEYVHYLLLYLFRASLLNDFSCLIFSFACSHLREFHTIICQKNCCEMITKTFLFSQVH